MTTINHVGYTQQSQRGVDMKTVTLAEAKALANDLYCAGSDDDVEVDDLTAADVSQGDTGCWVRAWVWLYDVQIAEVPL